eukprot:13447962-Alexandrium_andersonii.AAC.1
MSTRPPAGTGEAGPTMPGEPHRLSGVTSDEVKSRGVGGHEPARLGERRRAAESSRQGSD